MTMAEQLQYQIKFNLWKAEQKKKEEEGGGAGGSNDKKDDGGFKEKTKEELGRMTMAEQLQYQMKFNLWKAEQKKKEEAGGGGDSKDKKEDGGF